MYGDDRLSCRLTQRLNHLQVVPKWEGAHTMSELTKEQFGLDLYDTIACCAGVQQLLRMIAAGVSQGKDVAHLSERYGFEKRKAQAMMEAAELNGEDAARLARQYPWLLA